MTSTNIYDLRALERLRRERDWDARDLRRFRNDLLKRFLPDEHALRSIPDPAALQLHFLQLHQRLDSNLDGATKLLLRTAAGLLLEAVILRTATGRTTLCVSSQVGCAAACAFCATGQMGIARDLSVGEILDQVLLAGQLLRPEQRVIRNIVFMGMGEPFHNEEHLHGAIAALVAPELYHHSPTKILVSTVGITDALRRFATRFPTVHIAVSLHSVRTAVREALIPIARKYPLDDLRAAIVELNRLSKFPVMVEYLLLAGVNDSEDDARELMDWLAGLRVHVNLIPYNRSDEVPQLTGTPRSERDRFAGWLKGAGFKTTIRYSLGSDIGAACGQLVRHESRQLARGTPPVSNTSNS